MRLIEQNPEPEMANEPNMPMVESKVSLGMLCGNSPRELIVAAVETAKELNAIITHQRLFVEISGHRYVKVEGWTTLGIMLGCVAREVETTERDGIYTSIVELTRIADSVCISRASAECGDESPWNKRPRYARRSMAQTRATSKAARLAFSWIMVLAGYEVTPAEEMYDERSTSIEKGISKEDQETVKLAIKRSRIRESWILQQLNISSVEELKDREVDQVLEKIGQWAEALAAKHRQ